MVVFFDIACNNYVCVVVLILKSFKRYNPINKIISIRGARFIVLKEGSTFGNSQDLKF
jgi:hypothetical protein